MFRPYFSYEVGDKRQQKCLPWTLPPGIVWFLTTVIGSIPIPWCRCSWMVSWSSSRAWRTRPRWCKPSSWIRRWVDDGKRMGNSWLVYGWTWRNAHWIYIYIHTYQIWVMILMKCWKMILYHLWWMMYGWSHLSSSFATSDCVYQRKNIWWNDETWLYNDGRELISQSPASIVLSTMGNIWMNQLIRFTR